MGNRLESLAERQLPRVADYDRDRIVPLVKFIAASDLVAQPRPLQWQIRGVFLRNTTIALIGAPATFKSFGAVDMAACIATGIDWHGRPTSKGAVFYLAGEGNAGIARRLKAWEIVHGSLDGAPLFVSSGGIGLLDPLNAEAVAVEVERLAAAQNASPALVVVDTLARNFGDGDENSSADMGRFIQNLDRHIREPFGCTVKLVHHTGLADGARARGSSALRAAVDTEIIFERVGQTVTMRCTKAKDSPEFEPMAFEARSVELPWQADDGNPETSFVMQPAAAVPQTPQVAARIGKNEDKALACLERLLDDARSRLELSGNDPAQALILRDDWRRECIGGVGIPRNRFYEVIETLKRKNQVRIEGKHVVRCESGHESGL